MKIAVTAGDVNGIGLELFTKVLDHFYDDLILYSNKGTYNSYLKAVGLTPNHCEIKNIDFDYKPQLGTLSSKSGKHAILSIQDAVNDAIQGKVDAIVTLPINKESVYKAGWKYPGHTEFFADKFKEHDFNMLLAYENIRVIPITIHVPLKEVSNKISSELIKSKIRSFKNSLVQDFGIKNPRIAILGLNPHAGENGTIGNEELEIIIPAINDLKELNLDGPFPADGFFGFGEYLNYDGIVSMYHDQGLIPLKLISKGAGVNVTSGLPIVRTSPDHGTAFEIAGKNIASAESLKQSIILAKEIVENRKGLK